MQELGLVQYTQPSDIKRSYPDLLLIEVNKDGHPANGAFLVVKSKDIPALVARYRGNPALPSYQYPKTLIELGVIESETRYWIPTKFKIYEQVVSVIRENGRLINRLTNPTPSSEIISKPRRMSGERGPSTTPCVGICTTTNCGDAVCRGCGRTAEQVILWNSYDDEEKIAINNVLKSMAKS